MIGKLPVEVAPIAVRAVDDVGERDLVDISVADRDELFLLANGVVTHNCTIGMGYHYRARYECVLFFEKGKRKLERPRHRRHHRAPRINSGYPAEKPPEVSEVLIKQSTRAGRARDRSVHGLGLGRRRGDQATGATSAATICAPRRSTSRGRDSLDGGAREDSAPLRTEPAPQLGLTL